MFGNLRIGIVGALVLGSSASADVQEFSVVKLRKADQVSISHPGAANSHRLSVEVDVAAGDVGSATVNGLSMLSSDPESFEYSASFPTEAMLDAAFPPALAYNLQIQGGALGTRNETVSLPQTPNDYPSLPALTPTSFLEVQNADATQNLTLQWIAPGGPHSLIGVEIYDTLTDVSPVEVLLPAGQTSLFVAAGTLQQNRSYEITIFFANATFFNGSPAPGGFGVGASGAVAFVTETEIQFQTSLPAPCVDLNYYDVIKWSRYQQTANGAVPAQPSSYEFLSEVEAASGGSFASVTVTAGAGPGYPLINQFPGEWEYSQEFFGPTAKADMDAEFPSASNYTLAGIGGSLGARGQTLTLSPDAYPPAPILIGTSYSSLQGMDSTLPLSIFWSVPAGTTNRVFVEICDVLLDDDIVNVEVPLATTSFVIPAGLLLPGRSYEFHVLFANASVATGDDCPGFGTSATELFGFVADTLALFTTDLPFDQICNGDGGDQMGCTDCPCGNNAAPGTIGGCLNSAARSARLQASGSFSVSLPTMSTTDLRFSFSGAPNNAFCILNSGDGLAPGNMANPCFGANSGGLAVAFDGLRCAIMNTRRHGGRAADSNGNVGVTNNPWGGEGGPPVGIANAGPGFSAGQTRYFQVIHRDDALLSCMRGLNTSQAVQVTFTP